ncbi:MAG: hypothetical protein ABL890_02815 [Candidatus Peribacteraceae bacterium]
MSISFFHQELAHFVHADQRSAYEKTIAAGDALIGRGGEISEIAIRVIKGTQMLRLHEALLTRNGLATVDRALTDCGAAMVRQKEGGWKRYVGKTSPHSVRIETGYYPDAKEIGIRSSSAPEKRFSASALAPREGEIISVDFGEETLEGVLEQGPLTEHIRACLASFEKDLENIGLLLRAPNFHRYSDTRTGGIDGIRTLYTDGAQMHVVNQNTVHWQNETCPEHIDTRRYRPNIVMQGEGLTPNIEDMAFQMDVTTRNLGDVPLFYTSLTPRCATTSRDPLTGQNTGKQPNQWLSEHRPVRPWSNKPTMGANVDTPPEYDGARIQVGSRLTIRSLKNNWKQ